MRAAETIRRVLVSDGWNVAVLHNGAQALQRAVDEEFDAVVLDIMLPERRGNEILAALRSGENGDLIPKSKVIVMTNFEQDEESRMAMEHHADAYLIKAEITPRKLLAVIEELDK